MVVKAWEKEVQNCSPLSHLDSNEYVGKICSVPCTLQNDMDDHKRYNVQKVFFART